MSIIHHPAPDASVTAYVAFSATHDPDVSNWTADTVCEYSRFITEVAEQVQPIEAGRWSVAGRDDLGLDLIQFDSALAAALWLAQHPVSA